MRSEALTACESRAAVWRGSAKNTWFGGTEVSYSITRRLAEIRSRATRNDPLYREIILVVVGIQDRSVDISQWAGE
jgi:hypothetical protein